MLLKIGELAKRTGLTVRTLHHYDAIGLLAPSARSGAGYRLYNRQDIERLHRIQALRRFDLSLTEVAKLLADGSADLQSVIEQQIASLDSQVMRTVALRDRLKLLLANVNNEREPDLSDWLVTLQMMTMYDKYFTREEVDSLCSFEKALLSELTAVVIAVRSLMVRMAPPECAEAQALAKPWLVLSMQHMNDDARLILKLDAMHRNEVAVQALTGVDSDVLDYMVLVTAEFRLQLYARHLDAGEIAQVRDGFFRNYRRWPALFAELRQLRDAGADPCGAETQDFYARWIRLFQDSWGCDPLLREKILRANEQEPDITLGSGLDRSLLDFLARAGAHMRTQQQEQQQ